MQLVERHIISKKHKDYKQIDHLCFLSKNLYNSTLYRIKNYKEETGDWLRYNKLEKEFRLEGQPDYNALPSNTSQQILMIIDNNLKSYFTLLRKWKNDKKSLTGCPKFPHYKHKTKGRNVIIFTYNQAKLKTDKGIITFPKRSGLSPLKTKVDNLNQVRIIPQSSCYVIEVIYTKPEQQLIEQNNEYLSIDLGLNNLATCYDTTSNSSIIINGKPLKSINQYYNKKKGKLQSNLEKNHKKKSSKKLNKLTLKRNNKIKDYLHKSSRFIVNYCLESGISNIIIGHNKDWKQEINIGKVNNQKFVNIPHTQFIDQLKYKATLVGINVQVTEESYTSKCSALDLEEICKHNEYLGKRIKRGLFKSSLGKLINADLNGAINILRKVIGDKVEIQTQTNRGQVLWPLKITSSINK